MIIGIFFFLTLLLLLWFLVNAIEKVLDAAELEEYGYHPLPGRARRSSVSLSDDSITFLTLITQDL